MPVGHTPISPELRRVLKQSERILRIIWGLLLATSLFFVVLAYRIGEESKGLPARPELEDARSVLVFIALAMGSLSFFVFKRFPSTRQLQILLSTDASAQTVGNSIPLLGPLALQQQQLDAYLKRMPPLEQRLLRLPGLIALPSIVSFSLNEGLCVLALFIAQLSPGDIQQTYPLLAAGVGLQLLMLPRLDRQLARALRLAQSSKMTQVVR